MGVPDANESERLKVGAIHEIYASNNHLSMSESDAFHLDGAQFHCPRYGT